uniref:Venom peptide HtSTx n=1 Tax=Hadogenes troglodytes TaxID=1577150 RepID=A0A1B3IJ31_9SCOR|nr:venom peptide HtSTx [Hadogenes troglodytes]
MKLPIVLMILYLVTFAVGVYSENEISMRRRARCIRRERTCSHNKNGCCNNAPCRCNILGTNCKCHRRGLLQRD